MSVVIYFIFFEYDFSQHLKNSILDDYYQKGIEYYRRQMPRASDDQVVLAKEAKHKYLRHLK